MVLGLPLATFTAIHVVISLVGIGTGIVVVAGMLKANPLPAWTAVFLATTVLTSVTGFLFPFEKIVPSHIVGALSLLVLAAALLGLYAYHLAGRGAGSTSSRRWWRSTSTSLCLWYRRS